MYIYIISDVIADHVKKKFWEKEWNKIKQISAVCHEMPEL